MTTTIINIINRIKNSSKRQLLQLPSKAKPLSETVLEFRASQQRLWLNIRLVWRAAGLPYQRLSCLIKLEMLGSKEQGGR